LEEVAACEINSVFSQICGKKSILAANEFQKFKKKSLVDTL